MKCIDLFSGCGGMSLGFEKAGYEILAAFENWPKAINIYNHNFNHPVIEQDLTKEEETIELINSYEVDMIIGGPPCQDFSSAGKRDVTLGRADLTYHFANIVCGVRPNWFVMENVERIKKSHILKDISEQLESAGYGLTGTILNSAYCNVPQRRTRFFLIGQLGGKNNSLHEILRSKLEQNEMTVRDYFGNSLNLEYYYRHPRNYSRRGIYSIDEPSPTVRGVNRPIPAGYKKHKGDPPNVKLEEIRPLTTIERSYLQTFPPDFVFEGTKTNLEQMIGNAVPVNLAKFVGESIEEFISNRPFRKAQQLELLSSSPDRFIIPERYLRPFVKGL